MTTFTIPFEWDFKHNKLSSVTTKMKITDGTDTETVSVQIPIIDPISTKFQFLFTINKFNQARMSVQWTTGPKLFRKLRELLLDPSDLQGWESEFTVQGYTETVDNFDLMIEYLIHKRFEHNMDAYDEHHE